jgi:hypothetical protein
LAKGTHLSISGKKIRGNETRVLARRGSQMETGREYRGGYDTFPFDMNASKGEWIEGVNEKNQRLRFWVLE